MILARYSMGTVTLPVAIHKKPEVVHSCFLFRKRLDVVVMIPNDDGQMIFLSAVIKVIVKSAGLDQLHQRVLKELAKKSSELLMLIFNQFWTTGEVAGGRKKTNICQY